MSGVERLAVELLIAMCESEEQAAGMTAVKEMLSDMDEVAFAMMSDDKKEEWVGDYLPE